MPVSHGCCQMEVPTVSYWNAAVQVKSANVQIDLSAVAGHSRAIYGSSVRLRTIP